MKGTKRSLQACPVFSYDGSGGVNNLNNWTGNDNGSSTTLKNYCMANNCCGLSSTTPTANACKNWNTSSSTYEICPNSCNGDESCLAIARFANGSTVKIGSDACKGIQTCIGIAKNSSSATVEVQMNACDGDNACSNIALEGTGSATVEVQMNACDGSQACKFIRRDSTAEANVLIEASECATASECQNCGRDSDFTGIFDANQSCCDVVNTGENNNFLDTACHESNVPSGKKQT